MVAGVVDTVYSLGSSLCLHAPGISIKSSMQHAAYYSRVRIPQVQLCFLFVAAALISSASASPNEATFEFNYGFDPAVISMEMVNYTDSEGTALRVSTQQISRSCKWISAFLRRVWQQGGSQHDSLLALQGYFAYNNSTMTERPAVVVIPDYDGIGPYEFWRANLLAQLGYAGMPMTQDVNKCMSRAKWGQLQ